MMDGQVVNKVDMACPSIVKSNFFLSPTLCNLLN